MDASFVPKRSFDLSAVQKPEPFSNATTSSTKRRHHHQPSSAPPQATFRTSQVKLAAGEALFRILCPATKTGGLIGKGGAIIRQFREETGAKIRIDESVPGCEERVILIVADSTKKESNSTVDGKQSVDNDDTSSEELTNSSSNLNCEDEESPAQQALVRVFERILKVHEERSGVSSESKCDEREEGGGVTPQGTVVCRLLAPSNQVGCVLGRGGKIIERIRHGSGAHVRVFPKEQIPPCASPGDELIQISGNFSAVRKALLSVSDRLQDNPRADAPNSATTKSSGMALHGTGMPTQVEPFPQQGYASDLHTVNNLSRGYPSVSGIDSIGTNHRLVLEEDVVFKLLCQFDKVGSLIGKGGSIIRALQSETGASIKIVDAAPDSDERVVVISARENSEQRHSPAQDAVIRVHCRIAEIGFELGAAVVARLLVHSQQIRCLLGKGSIIISELRRVTGASIHIFPMEQVPKYGSQNDEVVQVIGSLQSVQDALFQITSRLREMIFPIKPHLSNVSGSPYPPPYPEMPPPLFRPRHDPASPGYPSPVGFHRPEPRPTFSHGMDRLGPTYIDRVPYPYGSERPGHGPSFDRQSSPGRWISQAGGSGNTGEVADVGGGFSLISGPAGSRSQAPIAASTAVEVVIPQTLLSYVYGENNSNLVQIRQISGANVVVHDPRPGATEGVVVVSGTPDQIHAAQSLIQAFILSEQDS